MDFFKPADYFIGSPNIGMYTAGHIIFIAVFVITTLLVCLAFRKASKNSIKRYLLCMTILWWALEIFKFVLSFFITDLYATLGEMLPLYLCSLYLYALPAAIFGKGKLKIIGEYCLISLCLVCGIMTVFYTAALYKYPAWSFYGLHSLAYHGSMAVTGIYLLVSGYVRPQFKRFIYGFLPVIPLSVPAIILNNIVDTDYMLMRYGLGTPLGIFAKAMPQPLYIICMFAAYILLTLITVGLTSAPGAVMRANKKVKTD